MIELNKKYREDTINRDELIELKDGVQLMDDNQLSLQLEEEWTQLQDEIIEQNESIDESLRTIKSKIDHQITESSREVSPKLASSNNTFFKRILQVAASLLIPLFLTSTLYFYHQTKVLESADMVVSTGKGEFANIVLPDGTKVTLNSESTLSYAPHLFNKKSRSISFEGEAYFDITKKVEGRNFAITTTDLVVEVLGTKFNLLARDASQMVYLSLEEGEVLLTALLTGENRTISPNQVAELLKSTGEINVTYLSNANISSWRDKKIIFRDIPFKSVVANIERIYDVEITFDPKTPTIKDNFSGVLPSNNLIESLQIIEASYRINASVEGDQVVITSK